MIDLLLITGGALVFITLVPILLKKLGQHLKGPEVLPYKLKGSLMTPTELKFYKRLCEYLPDDVLIFSKVSLKDIFYVGQGVGRNYMKYFNKIARKHVDFLVCSEDSVAPLYGIELDDKSHNKPKRQERDAFVDSAYKVAGLRLIHVPVKREYPKEYLDQHFLCVIAKEEAQAIS